MSDFEKHERNVRERVGGPGRLHEFITNPASLEAIAKNKLEIVTGHDRFLVYLNSFCLGLISDGQTELTNVDIDRMLEKTRAIPELKYKNHIAYALGYIASNGGENITEKNVKKAFTILKQINHKGVEEQDVIRYARLWMNL